VATATKLEGEVAQGWRHATKHRGRCRHEDDRLPPRQK